MVRGIAGYANPGPFRHSNNGKSAPQPPEPAFGDHHRFDCGYRDVAPLFAPCPDSWFRTASRALFRLLNPVCHHILVSGRTGKAPPLREVSVRNRNSPLRSHASRIIIKKTDSAGLSKTLKCEMAGEPLRCNLRHFFQCSWFLEQMRGSGNDKQFLLAASKRS